MKTAVATPKYTVDMFAAQRGHFYTEAELKEWRPRVTSHEFIWFDHPEREKALFYTSDHLYGYKILPDNCVPCGMSLPRKIASRPGFEDGYVHTAEDDCRLTIEGTPHRVKLMTSLEELVDYLNQYC